MLFAFAQIENYLSTSCRFDCLNFVFGFQFADCFLSMAKKKVSARAESRQAEEALYVFANFKASKMLVHLETNIIKDTSMLFFLWSIHIEIKH